MQPERIGRYQITGELGRGAMGVVYRATDPTIGRVVALKTLRLDAVNVSREDLVRRFRHEARAAGALNQRNIITIYDAGEAEGNFYIAMEYLAGMTLAQLLARQRTLATAQILDLGQQLLAGLEYAHQHGVIHRDMKPANVLLATDGTVKIMDFGIAKASSEATLTAMTAAGHVVGTPDYMSPEQVKGNPLDGRSDLFSVGVMLYEMATGERPFVGQSITTVIYKIVHETPIPPHELDAGVDAGLSAVISRALEKAPEKRFASAREMSDALGGRATAKPASTTMLNAPTLDVAPSSTAPLAPTRKKRGRWVAAGVAAAVVIGLLLLLVPGRKSQTPPQPQTASEPAAGPSPPTTPATAERDRERAQQQAERDRQRAAQQLERAQAQAERERERAQRQEEKGEGKNPAAPSVVPPLPDVGTKDWQKFGAETQARVMASLRGGFQITSTPDGATVQVDGKGSWTTPAKIEQLEIGVHSLQISKPGYKTVSMPTVPIEPGKIKKINVKLERGEGAVSQVPE